MGNSILDQEYYSYVKNNPEKKFILYLRTHLENIQEKQFITDLEVDYGKCSYLPKERLVIFILPGKHIPDFIDKLNHSKLSLSLSFIQSEDELSDNNKYNN